MSRPKFLNPRQNFTSGCQFIEKSNNIKVFFERGPTPPGQFHRTVIISPITYHHQSPQGGLVYLQLEWHIINENLKIFQFFKKCMFHKFQNFRVNTSFTLVFFTFVFFMRTLTYFPIAQPLKIVSFDQNHLLPSFFHHKKRKKMFFLF